VTKYSKSSLKKKAGSGLYMLNIAAGIQESELEKKERK
jgi:hypothetical protein